MRSKLSFLAIALTLVFGRYTSVAEAHDHVMVGVITPLSGRMATIGSAVKNGVELAKAERPELFKPLEFVYEDDQFDGKRALSAYQKLRAVDHISILFGFGDTLAEVVGPLAEKDKVLLINFNFDASFSPGKTYVVRAMNHTRQYMEALAEYLLSERNSKFTSIRAQSLFFTAMAESFAASVNGRAPVENLQDFNPTDVEFRPTILKLKSNANTPVGLFLAPDQLIAFMKQSKELGFGRTFYGTDLFETSAGIAADKTLFENCLYPDNDVTAEFRSRYRAKFGNEAQLTFAGSAYDMAILIGEIFSVPKQPTLNAILKSLESVEKRSGVLGNFSFVNDAQYGKFFQYPVRVKRITAGIGVPVP